MGFYRGLLGLPGQFLTYLLSSADPPSNRRSIVRSPERKPQHDPGLTFAESHRGVYGYMNHCLNS